MDSNDTPVVAIVGKFNGEQAIRTVEMRFGNMKPSGVVKPNSMNNPPERNPNAALTPKLDPAKGYRYVFKSGPGDLGGLLIGELYDRYDLLEPIARADFAKVQTP